MWLFTSKKKTHTHTQLLKWIREEHVESSSAILKVEVCWEKYKISKIELFAKIVKGFHLSSKHILIMPMRRFICGDKWGDLWGDLYRLINEEIYIDW